MRDVFSIAAAAAATQLLQLALYSLHFCYCSAHIKHYTVSGKTCHYTFASNFAKYGPIFKILSRNDFAVNLQ